MPVSVAPQLENNLTAHRTRWGFAPAAAGDDSRVRVESTAGPWPRVSLRMSDGHWLRVHSDRQPLDEAARTIAQSHAEPFAASLVCLVGAGYGYALDVLDTQAAPDTKILVVEPEPAFLPLWLGRRDWTSLIGAGRLMILAGPAYEGRTEAWRLVSPEAPDPAVISHPVIGRAREDDARAALQIVAQAVKGARANEEARRQFAAPYLLNTLRNLPHIVHGPDPGVLTGAFEGVPAIIVGAGPSLDRNLPALRDVADRALVIATDTAWRPLTSFGIDPALVVAADPSDINGRHLRDVPARRETWLLAEGSVDPRALQASAGHVSTFRIASHHPWPWLDTLGLRRHVARIWGSVMTAAFDLALTYGCDPIVFAGADLAFTDERPYCRGTTFEGDWAPLVARGVSLRDIWQHALAAREMVRVPGLDGRDVRTAPHLLEFRNWLVARAAEHPARRVINATGAGLLMGAHIEQADDLRSVLDPQPARDVMLRNTLRRSLQTPTSERLVRQVLDALDAIARDALSGETTAAASPLTEWLAFGRPSLTREDIHAAATEARASIASALQHGAARARAGRTDDRSPLRMHAADRVARMRARATGDAAVLNGVSQDNRDGALDGQAADAARQQADRLLDQLLATPGPIATGPGIAGDDEAVPLSYRFAWTPDAASAVAHLEELLLATEASVPARDESFWTRTIAPVIDRDQDAAADAPALDHESHARLVITRQRLASTIASGNAADDASALSRRRSRRVIDAMAYGLSDRQMWTADGLPYRLELRGWRTTEAQTTWPCPLRIDAFMRALTGTIATRDVQPVAAAPDGCRFSVAAHDTPTTDAVVEPRRVFLDHEVSYIEPDILTERGLPRAWHCATDGDRGAALTTPYLSMHSLHVFPDGRSEPAPGWPVAITGEVPWGPDGGALAWNDPESMLLWRERAGAPARVTRVAFHPRCVAIDEDGTAFWWSADNTLWAWRPGGPAQHLCETPPCDGVHVEGPHLHLAPVVRDPRGPLLRQRLPYLLRYDRSARALRHVDAGAAGPHTGRASRGPWTARAYPFSDLVELTHTNGRSFALACHAPFRVAWSGPSLVATTGEGVVLLFRNPVEHLTLPV